MSVTRASLLDRLRHPAMAAAETQKTILHTGCACADMREAADEIERLRAAITTPTPAMLAAAMQAWLDYDLPEDCEWDDGLSTAIWMAMCAADQQNENSK